MRAVRDVLWGRIRSPERRYSKIGDPSQPGGTCTAGPRVTGSVQAEVAVVNASTTFGFLVSGSATAAVGTATCASP